MTYFVIVYDRESGTLVACEEFDASIRHEALSRRFELEEKFNGRPEVEIVVLGGLSLRDIQVTHGRYFKGVAELAEA